MMPATGHQILRLKGLRFNASLGILAHEKSAPQAIQVDAELNMGAQPLRPAGDDIQSVLDYRKVHALVIDTCTEKHIHLLESLTGILCTRLLELQGVIGVRVSIIKLNIFDDCEVSIQHEAGIW